MLLAVDCIQRNHLRLDGVISSDGSSSSSYGGGAGGSIFLLLQAMSGAGLITASGGKSDAAGGGGGGRISVFVQDMPLFTGNILAQGGYGGYQSGSAGTVFVENTSTGLKNLSVFNEVYCESPPTLLSSNIFFDFVYSGGCAKISILGNVSVSSFLSDGTSSLEISSNSSLSGSGTLTISNFTIRCLGYLNFSSVEVQNSGQLYLTETGSSLGSVEGKYSVETLIIRSNGLLIIEYVDVTAADRSGRRVYLDCASITIYKNGCINSDGQGFPESTQSSNAGGSHGAGSFDFSAASGGGYGGTGGLLALLCLCCT